MSTRRIILGVASSVFLGCLLACSGTGGPAGTGSTGRTDYSEPPRPPRLTKAKYDAVTTGMTYSEVVAVIGFAGEELSRVEIAGATTVMYGWQNPDGSNMNATFQRGTLVAKAQFGLH